MIWHRPEPGPMHWDWRCLRCGEAVRLHAPWWRRLFHKRTVQDSDVWFLRADSDWMWSGGFMSQAAEPTIQNQPNRRSE